MWKSGNLRKSVFDPRFAERAVRVKTPVEGFGLLRTGERGDGGFLPEMQCLDGDAELADPAAYPEAGSPRVPEDG